MITAMRRTDNSCKHTLSTVLSGGRIRKRISVSPCLRRFRIKWDRRFLSPASLGLSGFDRLEGKLVRICRFAALLGSHADASFQRMCDTAAWCCLHFPPELRDIVIDCLRHDTAALRACSLTCKAWLPRARHHLFHTAEIHPGRRGDNFKSLLLDTPELGQYIREVRISGVVQDPYGPDTILSGRWPTLTAVLGEPAGEVKTPELRSVDWLRSVLPTSTKLLARVTALKLFSFPITQPLAELLGGHFSRVHVVHLDACRAETFGHYLALPRALSHVHHLHMDGITWYRPTYPAAPMITRPCSLKSLSLAVKVDAATVINWLLDYRRHLALSSLSCYLASDASAIAVHKLLDAVGPGLRDFTVGFSDVRDPTGTNLMHSNLDPSPDDY